MDAAELTGTLLTMARTGKQRGWWAKYGDLPATHRQYIGLESAAEVIHNFEMIVVPGLLQTEAYSRAVTSVSGRAPAAVEQREAARMARQKLITEGEITLIAVLDEAVLHRRIGGAEVMKEQLTALLAAGKLWNVTLHVIPFREGAYASMVSSFHVLRLPEVSGVVYIEGLTGDLYAEDHDVARCAADFTSMRASGLSPAASLAMIKKIRIRLHAT